MATYYSQPCPICGRTLQVRVQYLGRRISCRHCHGEFQASDPTTAHFANPPGGNELMERVEALLDTPTDSSPN